MHRLACVLLAAAWRCYAGDVNDDLLAAARKGDLDTVKALIDKGAPVEAKTPYGQTPLYLAAMSGHEAVVRFLLDKGAKTDVTDTFYKASMLDFVLERKHYAVAKMMIAKGIGNADDATERRRGFRATPTWCKPCSRRASPARRRSITAMKQPSRQTRSDVAELLKKAGAHEPPPPVAVDAKVLESYVGTYKTDQPSARYQGIR